MVFQLIHWNGQKREYKVHKVDVSNLVITYLNRHISSLTLLNHCQSKGLNPKPYWEQEFRKEDLTKITRNAVRRTNLLMESHIYPTPWLNFSTISSHNWSPTLTFWTREAELMKIPWRLHQMEFLRYFLCWFRFVGLCVWLWDCVENPAPQATCTSCRESDIICEGGIGLPMFVDRQLWECEIVSSM
jgi:hypothetical protein